jgi:hypothetical protein
LLGEGKSRIGQRSSSISLERRISNNKNNDDNDDDDDDDNNKNNSLVLPRSVNFLNLRRRVVVKETQLIFVQEHLHRLGGPRIDARADLVLVLSDCFFIRRFSSNIGAARFGKNALHCAWLVNRKRL